MERGVENWGGCLMFDVSWKSLIFFFLSSLFFLLHGRKCVGGVFDGSFFPSRCRFSKRDFRLKVEKTKR